ncbi:hypothetical protein DIURU_002129 [Diutina rugosa]|uniref:VLRF1 domain-containing protein n=1 Tax=Diutina rugosa TaxID=5481 RepID=A0A642URF8_DIURU|nr:uncharacterized protein DIURU_002129 [Diutina rugosa]KAA8903907.1 hypothetical protein DIURU_002129 [Diutina rugosa]
MRRYIYDLDEATLSKWKLLQFDSNTLEVKSNTVAKFGHENFSSPKHDMEYYHSDCYRFNLKRKVLGLPELTEDEFNDLIENESIESLSGSESESEGEAEVDRVELAIAKLSANHHDEEVSEVSHLASKTPFIMFTDPELEKDEALAIYKANFSPKQLDDPKRALAEFSAKPIKDGKSAVFMIGGGHFAGAIINHKLKDIKGMTPSSQKESKQEMLVDVLKSKTFHRYTVRKKQGGSQSSSDNARGKANSAGSSIRRYNEQALIKEIRELLVEWKDDLDECHSIYLRANGASNRKILVFEDGVLRPGDERIRNFPFTTRRATKSELKRAWTILSYTHLVNTPKVSQKKDPAPDKSQSPTPLRTAPDSVEDTQSKELVQLLRKQKAPKLLAYLKSNQLDVNTFRFSPEKQYVHYPTLLHYAASNNLTHMVYTLLVNLSADPTIKNLQGKTAAEICTSATHDMFRVARDKLGEAKWNWDTANVGQPISREELEKEKRSEQDRVKQEKQQAIKESIAVKTELEMKKPTIRSSGKLTGSYTKVDELSGLSEAQRMSLMREQRARAAEERIRKSQQSR